MHVMTRLLALLALTAGVWAPAYARSGAPWDGGYVGFDLGDASKSSCSDWSLTGTTLTHSTSAELSQTSCSSGGAFVGGGRVGENFQYQRFVWGLEADLDYWDAKTVKQTVTYTSEAPSGKYTFTSRPNPDAFLLIGPRVGYGGDTWFPYVTVAGILPLGPRNNELFYTAPGATLSTASFGAGKSYSSTGWAAGGGFELGLNGAWSISAEYLHANLGKGSDTATVCQGSASACAAFSGISLDSTRGGLTTNIFRVGVIYYFDYWDL
jgi:outer membrane immunogenic protein